MVARPLSEGLKRHTLLLELVGKSAGPDGTNLPFPQLLQNLQENSFHDAGINQHRVDAGDHADGQNLRRQETVEGYIRLIFNHISSLTPEQCTVLKVITLLPPATAYDTQFLVDWSKILDVEFRPVHGDTLVQLGWLKKEVIWEGGIGYSMHPLILDVAFRELEVTAEWAEKILEPVANSIHYDSTNPEYDFQKKRAAQPCADHLGKLFFQSKTNQVSYLLDRLATLEEVYGFYKNAARLGEQALHIAQAVLTEEVIATRQSNLATVYRNLGEYARARDLLEKALSSDEKNFGLDHENVAVIQSNLAIVYRKQGEYDRARDLLEKVLFSDEKNFGPDHPNIAVSQSNLANVYSDLGEYFRARDLLEKALSLDEKYFGPDHPSVATDYNNLAHVFFAEKNYPAAIEAFQKSLDIVGKTLGEHHPYYQMATKSLQAAQKAAAESI